MSNEAQRTTKDDGETDAGTVLEYHQTPSRLGLDRSQIRALVGAALCGAVAVGMGMIASGAVFDLDFGDFRYFAMALAVLAGGGALICAGGIIKL